MGSMSDWMSIEYVFLLFPRQGLLSTKVMLALRDVLIAEKAQKTEKVDKRLEIDFTNLLKATTLNFATASHSTEVSVAVKAEKLLKPFKSSLNLNFICRLQKQHYPNVLC